MSSKRAVIALVALFVILSGCGGGKDPSGPGGSVPSFTIWLSESAITPPQNAQVRLVITFPNEFNDLDGRLAFFSTSSEGGSFNNGFDSSYVNVNHPESGYLVPEVWYSYNGTQHEFRDTVKVHVVDLYNQTLAWNYGTILVH